MSLGKKIAFGVGGILVLLFAIGLMAGEDTAKNGKATPVKTATVSALPASYSGKWQGQDGTSIWIRGDKGDYDGGNVKVQGGGVSYDAKAQTLKISSFFGIGKEWNIEQEPRDSGGGTQMKLSGTVYRRIGGFTPGATAGFDPGKVPGQKELRILAQNTILTFDRAVKSRNFTAFHASVAPVWQEETTPQKLKEIFQTFIDKKADFAAVKDIKPIFTPAPQIDDDGNLQLNGYYPSGGNRLNFELSYAPEETDWKLIGISLKFRKGGS